MKLYTEPRERLPKFNVFIVSAPTKAAKVEFSPESTVLKSGTPKDSSLDKSQDFQDLSQANKVFGFEIEPDDVDERYAAIFRS